MLRAAVTLAGTAIGIGAVLAYQPDTGGGSGTDAEASGTNTPASAAVDLATSPATVTVTASPALPGTTPGGTAGAPGAAAAVWLEGDVVPVQWGDVQVRVQLEGTRITDVQAVSLPQGDSFSAQLSERVRTTLREEVLQAQSAEVDMVSGASYSSRAYLKSLQSALDKR